MLKCNREWTHSLRSLLVRTMPFVKIYFNLQGSFSGLGILNFIDKKIQTQKKVEILNVLH